VTRLRVATLFHEGSDLLPLSGDVRACLGGFAERLAAAGAQVEAVPLPVPLSDGLRAWQDIVLPILGAGLPDEAYAAFAALENVPGDGPLLNAGRAFAGRYRTWAQADERRQSHRVAWARLFERYDVVLAPVMPTTAFPHDTDRPLAERTVAADGTTISHQVAAAWVASIGTLLLPVVTLPTGLARDGLPVGVQVVGPFLADLRLLRIVQLLDTAAGPGFTPPPQ
jgi:amidase